MGNANGGYLLAMMGRAMQQHSGRRDPFTVTAHYLAPAPAGSLEIEVDTVKTGKLVTTMNATMRRGDRNIMRVLGAWGEMSAVEPQIVTATPPDLPPFDECTSRNSDGGEFTIGLLQNVTNRLHPDDSTFIAGTPSGTACMRGWIEFPDDRPMDTLALLLAVDSMPPPLFNLPYEKVGCQLWSSLCMCARYQLAKDSRAHFAPKWCKVGSLKKMAKFGMSRERLLP